MQGLRSLYRRMSEEDRQTFGQAQLKGISSRRGDGAGKVHRLRHVRDDVPGHGHHR